jgi:HAD superfamily hydrolase (TIGR01509 family)
MGVAAVLLDSGGVVLRPLGGRWNPRFDFEAVLARHHPEVDLDPARLGAAIAAGDQFLHWTPADRARDDYHRHLLAMLGVAEPSAALLADLDRPLPFAQVVEVFPDVVDTLEALRAGGLRMAVVSDAGPELDRAYAELGLGRYFETFAISAVVGVTKPDPRMYATASDGLGVAPSDCLFVDDDPELVRAAIELGYGGVALCRPPAATVSTVPCIRTLGELVPLALD